MKKLLSRFSVAGFSRMFVNAGGLFRSLPARVIKSLYFYSSSRRGFMVYIRLFLARLILRLFYKRLITPLSVNRLPSVTRTRSSYVIWSRSVRVWENRRRLRPSRYLPARLKITENYQPLKRNGSDRRSIPLIIYVPFVVLYLVYGSRPYDMPVVGSYFPTPTYTLTPTSISKGESYVLPALSPTPASSVVPGYVLPPQYSATRTPDSLSGYGFGFAFPVITDQGVFYTSVNQVLFSYYYPDLGGVNCHTDNWLGDRCKDTTASGESWRFYLGKGLAIHPDMFSKLPYGSIVYVTSPASIRGYYTVIDLCGGCLINGNYYFDFLLPDMPAGLTWSKPVSYGVIRIGWDGVFPTPTFTSLPTWTPSPTGTPTVTQTLVGTSSPTWTSTVTQTLVDTPSPTWTPTVTPTVLDTPTP